MNNTMMAAAKVSSQTSEQITFSSLPLDIVLTVADHLPPYSVACLSLTCKDLFHSPPIRRIWVKAFEAAACLICQNEDYCCVPGIGARNHDYGRFLWTLRRDLPEHTSCDYCQKLHPKPTEENIGKSWTSCSTNATKNMSLSWPIFDFYLQFEHVQCVMDRQRMGSRFGFPLDSIALSTDWKVVKNVRGSAFLARLDIQPEVSSRGLVLRTAQHAFFTDILLVPSLWSEPPSTIKVSRDAMGVFKVCKHHKTLVEDLQKSLETMVKYQGVDAYGRQCGWEKSNLSYCPSCNTHFCLDISRQIGIGAVVEGLEVTLHTWMYLGWVHHMHSPCWLNMAEVQGHLYSHDFLQQGKRVALREWNGQVLSDIRSQHDRIREQIVAHASLVPALDCAIRAQDNPRMAKVYEFTNLLRDAGYSIHSSVIQRLVDQEAAHLRTRRQRPGALQQRRRRRRRYDTMQSPDDLGLYEARDIILEHNKSVARAATSKWRKMLDRGLDRLVALFSRS